MRLYPISDCLRRDRANYSNDTSEVQSISDFRLTISVSATEAGYMARKVSKRVPVLNAGTRKTSNKVRKVTAAKKRKVAKAAELDLRGFPPESLVERTLALCLACALDVLTRHVGLSAERARSEIRRYNPRLEELTTTSLSRPYMPGHADKCPYCGAPSKWHAPLRIVRIEGGKNTDVPRRALFRNLGESVNFTIIEEKSTEREALYSWLSKTGGSLDLDSPGWLIEAARHWLARRLPKENWPEIMDQVRVVRRSRRLEDGFEKEGSRLFLAPMLFDEILVIQYLLSRSHKAGGQTFEGRLTLQELFHLIRYGGYLRRLGVTANNAADALEQLVEIHGGEGRVKFHYVVDRREFLARLADLKGARIPRSK